MPKITISMPEALYTLIKTKRAGEGRDVGVSPTIQADLTAYYTLLDIGTRELRRLFDDDEMNVIRAACQSLFLDSLSNQSDLMMEINDFAPGQNAKLAAKCGDMTWTSFAALVDQLRREQRDGKIGLTQSGKADSD